MHFASDVGSLEAGLNIGYASLTEKRFFRDRRIEVLLSFSVTILIMSTSEFWTAFL